MSRTADDPSHWDELWKRALGEVGGQLSRRPPNVHLLDEAARLQPAHALDAGCGHGAEALWLASRGWRVTAVDFSATALDYGRRSASSLGPELAERVRWVEADLGSWPIPEGAFELVTSIYVHVAGPVREMVRRLARGVAPDGRLILVGHRPVDPETGRETPAADQNQISIEECVEALDPRCWRVEVAEERRRSVEGTGVDAVFHARRTG